MSTDYIIQKLDSIEKMLLEQNMLQKEVFNFNETAIYLEVSHSNLYKLTSTGKLPFYKPNGKKIYFTRKELDAWLLTNRQSSREEILERASNLKLKSGRN
jgi:excisionase family DNA binding protein